MTIVRTVIVVLQRKTLICSRYLRLCCRLIYILITEAEVSQSADVGSAEGDAPLPSDAIAPFVKPLLPSHNFISSVVCSPSFFSTFLRTAGRLEAEILLYSELVNRYVGCSHAILRIHTPLF